MDIYHWYKQIYMVFGEITQNMEINMDLHHHHTITYQSYQPFSLFIGGVRSHQKK